MNTLWASWESSTGTAATEQTARARAVVETARSRISAVHGRVKEKADELLADGPGAVLRRQVEGGISVSSRSNARDSAHPRNALHADLNLPRVFSEDDASLFGDAMLTAANDHSTPLANVFSRVQVRKSLLACIHVARGMQLENQIQVHTLVKSFAAFVLFYRSLPCRLQSSYNVA